MGEIMRNIFEGCGVALVTPFKNNKVDFLSMGNLIDRCIDEGAQAIVILATTGEGSTINEIERKDIISFCRTKINKHAKLIVGTGNNNFETCYKNTIQAKEMGADGALVSPYYNKTTQQGVIEYYRQLAKIKFPFLIYNVPARTGLNIELDTIKKIVETNPYVYGIKESTCDINRIIKLHKICKDKISIYSGEDELNFLFYCLGAEGTISVTANVYTRQVQTLYNLVKQEKIEDARKTQDFLSPFNNALFYETNPIPIKYLLKKKGIIRSDEVRLPLVKLSRKNRIKINSLIQNSID